MERPLASIIIRCHNEERHIGRLLESIFQQTVKNIEVILVDSGSTDTTLSIARRYPVNICSIRPEDFSFGYSLNCGCRQAAGTYLVFASGHVYPARQDWLENMLSMFTDPKVALVYGKQRGDYTSKFSEHQIFHKMFPDKTVYAQDSCFCNNANAAIRRHLWEKIPYDETLTGLEDLDWAKRAINLGHCISYCAKAEVIHVHEESSSQIYNRYKREAIALKRIFPDDRFRFWDFARLLILNMGVDYYHAYRAGKLRQNTLGVAIFRLMQFTGTYSGFRFRRLISPGMKQKFFYPRKQIKHAPRQTFAPPVRLPDLGYTDASDTSTQHKPITEGKALRNYPVEYDFREDPIPRPLSNVSLGEVFGWFFGTDFLPLHPHVHPIAEKCRTDPGYVKILPDGTRASSERETGHAIYSIVRLLKPKNVIEIGCYNGASSICIAKALQDNGFGILHSIDISSTNIEMTKRNLENADLTQWVQLYHGDSSDHDVLDRLSTSEFIFIDGDHSYEGAKRDFENYQNKLDTRGIMLFHDTIKIMALRHLMQEIYLDGRFDVFTVATSDGDGITFIKRKKGGENLSTQT